MADICKHSTPPWHYDPEAKEVWRDETNPVGLATIFSGDDMGDPEEMDADGYLMAAAPEMFAALDGLVNNGFSDEELATRWRWPIAAIRAARAAFAKAGGKELTDG